MQINEYSGGQLLDACIRTLSDDEHATLTSIAAYSAARREDRPSIQTIIRFTRAFGTKVDQLAPFFGYLRLDSPRRWADISDGAQVDVGISRIHKQQLMGLFVYHMLGGRIALKGAIH